MSGCSYMLLNINALKIKKEYPATKKNTAFGIVGQFKSCIHLLERVLYRHFIYKRFFINKILNILQGSFGNIMHGFMREKSLM